MSMIGEHVPDAARLLVNRRDEIDKAPGPIYVEMAAGATVR